MSFPISLLFLTTGKGHFGRQDIYHKTLTDWKNKGFLDLFEDKVAHIKYAENEIKIKEKIEFDLLSEFQFPVISTKGYFKHFHKSHFIGIVEDLNRLAGAAKCEFSFILENDWLIHPYKENLSYYLAKSLSLFIFGDVICVRFPRHKDDLNHYDGIEYDPYLQINKQGSLYSFNPNIIRTRDLYIATEIALKNINLIENNSEVGMTNILRMFSKSPKPFLSFLPEEIRALHIGTKNSEEEDKI